MKTNLSHQNITPEQFVAYMHGAVDFLPPAGPDPVQWQAIKDLIVRVALAPAAPVSTRAPCGPCSGHN